MGILYPQTRHLDEISVIEPSIKKWVPICGNPQIHPSIHNSAQYRYRPWPWFQPFCVPEKSIVGPNAGYNDADYKEPEWHKKITQCEAWWQRPETTTLGENPVSPWRVARLNGSVSGKIFNRKPAIFPLRNMGLSCTFFPSSNFIANLNLAIGDNWDPNLADIEDYDDENDENDWSRGSSTNTWIIEPYWIIVVRAVSELMEVIPCYSQSCTPFFPIFLPPGTASLRCHDSGWTWEMEHGPQMIHRPTNGDFP